MVKTRKKYTPKFKAKVFLETIKVPFPPDISGDPQGSGEIVNDLLGKILKDPPPIHINPYPVNMLNQNYRFFDAWKYLRKNRLGLHHAFSTLLSTIGIFFSPKNIKSLWLPYRQV